MKTTGIEDLGAALRRSAWVILVLVVVGAGAMTAIKQSRGAFYEATSTVILAPAALTSSISGIDPVYVDPTRQDEQENNLASASQLYDLASQRAGGRYGSGGHFQDVTRAGGGNSLVSFTVVTRNPGDAIAIANAVARAYPGWRASVFGQTIQTAISELRARLEAQANPTLADQLQRLEALQAMNYSGTLFVEPAIRAAKTTPRPVRDALLGGAIGLMAAMLVAGFRELLDTRVRSELDVEEALGAPVLATVHSLPRRARKAVLTVGGSKHGDTYELLAANVAHLLDAGDRRTYLAVTSAVAGEGKTTTAAHLGAALARRGTNVVLADFDLRKPTLSGLFSIPAAAAGVHEILDGSVKLESALWRVPLNGSGLRPEPLMAVPLGRHEQASAGAQAKGPAGHGSLIVLPAGMPASNGAGLFSRLPRLLDELQRGVGLIIIDTPPALLTAGVVELSQRVDGVLVVARQGMVTRRRLRTLGRQAQAWRSTLIGAVLNDAPRDVGYGYYSPGSS